MNETKPWYASKTIWASAAAIIGAALSFFGMPFGAGTEQLLAERLTELATVIAGLVALYGRLTAEKRIDMNPIEPWNSGTHHGAA